MSIGGSPVQGHGGGGGGGGFTNPMTTIDDLIVGGAAGAPGRLGKGSDGQVLTVDPVTHHLIWATPSSGAPTGADYWVETVQAGLSAEVIVGTTGITTAAYAARQAAAKAGRIFLPSDGFKAERDTGAAWAAWGPIFPLGAQPVSTDFAWINQGGASVTNEKGGMYMASATGATTNIRLLKKAAPAPPYTITVFIIPLLHHASFQHFGLAFRQSSDGKLHLWGPAHDGNPKWWSAKWTNPTTYSADYLISTWSPFDHPLFLRIADDNTNRICSYSLDGQHFITLQSILRTDFLTADEVGLFIYNNNATFAGGINVLSWVQA